MVNDAASWGMMYTASALNKCKLKKQEDIHYSFHTNIIRNKEQERLFEKIIHTME